MVSTVSISPTVLVSSSPNGSFSPELSESVSPILGEPIDFGQAISFNGTGGIRLPDDVFSDVPQTNTVADIFKGETDLLGGSFTITGWLNPESPGTVVWHGETNSIDVLQISTTSDGNLAVLIRVFDPNTNPFVQTYTVSLGDGELTAGEWHSFAVRYDEGSLTDEGSGSLTAFLDGKQYRRDGLGTRIQGLSVPVRDVKIGQAGNDDFYEGQLDELGFWDRALSDTEIQEFLYSEDFTGTENGLVAYYTFDEDSNDSDTGTITIHNQVNDDGFKDIPVGPNLVVRAVTTNDGTLSSDAGEFVGADIPNFVGYVDITLDTPVESELGMIIRYELDTAAVEGTDFYSSQIDISTTDDEAPFNGIFIPQGETSARIHITALPDAVVDADTAITLNLLPYDADLLGPFEEYDVDASINSQTFTLFANDSFSAGVAIADVFGEDATVANLVADENGEAVFQVKLTSEPTDTVTVSVLTDDGTASASSLSFDASNWDAFQAVTVSGLNTADNVAANVDLGFTSNDSTYSGLIETLTVADSTDDVKIRVTEGGTAQIVTPTVSVLATNDAIEGHIKPGFFTISLDTPAPETGL